jgi:hypothetical protein
VLRAVKEVWEIEIADVVANDEIRIYFLQEISPLHQHLLLPFKLEDLGIDNQARSIKAEYVPHKRLLFSVSSDNIGDLDNRILVCFWEDAFSARTFNIE